MFQKIRPKKVSDEVYEQVKKLILDGKLKPAEKLPPERELSTSLGVSRPSLREALQRLEGQGFLEQVHGDGTYVKSITSQKLDTVLTELARREETIFDLLEIRLILETWAAALAAERATPEEIDTMRQYLLEMEDAKNKGEIGYVSDAHFHSAISYATHNLILIHIMKNIYQWIEKISYDVRLRKYKNPQSHQDLYNQHLKIFTGIEQRNPEEARRAMQDHIAYIKKDLNDSLENKQKN